MKNGQLSQIETNAIKQHWSKVLRREILDDDLILIAKACEEWVKARIESYPVMAKLINDLQAEVLRLQGELEIAMSNMAIVGTDGTQLYYKKLREAEADKERLDWLLQRTGFVGLEVYHIPIIDRAAIDEAMKSVLE